MNWLAELAIILFAFNTVAGLNVALVAAIVYLIWAWARVATVYTVQKKIITHTLKRWKNETDKKRK